MDIKSVINDLVKKIKGDKDLLAKFKKNPTETVKSLAGEVSQDELKDIVEGVTSKIGTDTVKKTVGSKLKGLFKK